MGLRCGARLRGCEGNRALLIAARWPAAARYTTPPLPPTQREDSWLPPGAGTAPGDSRASFERLLTYCHRPPRRLNFASGFLARPQLPARRRCSRTRRQGRKPVQQHFATVLFFLQEVSVTKKNETETEESARRSPRAQGRTCQGTERHGPLDARAMGGLAREAYSGRSTVSLRLRAVSERRPPTSSEENQAIGVSRRTAESGPLDLTPGSCHAHPHPSPSASRSRE